MSGSLTLAVSPSIGRMHRGQAYTQCHYIIFYCIVLYCILSIRLYMVCTASGGIHYKIVSICSIQYEWVMRYTSS